jgi:hypothetical protein
MAGISYLFLGWGESDRPALVANLLRFGLDTSAQPTLVLVDPAHEAATREAIEQQRVEVSIETFEGAELEAVNAPEDATIFWIPSGASDPRDFLENIRYWLEARGDELGRIFTVIDCELQIGHPSSHGFYDLCIHFSDVLLLGNRDAVSKKEIQAYRDQLKKAAIPCRTELLKSDGKVTHPHELLFPEARRLSLFFDPPEDEQPGSSIHIEGIDEAEDPEEDGRDPGNDPYLARTTDGQRQKIVHLPKV